MGGRAANEIDQRIAKRLRAARLEAKMTQQDAADKLGITFQQLQKYEHGYNRISCGRLSEVASIYGKNPGWFFGGDQTASVLLGDEFFTISHSSELARAILATPKPGVTVQAITAILEASK
jgi:transcriptional regulator with XRE-family HTH domain